MIPMTTRKKRGEYCRTQWSGLSWLGCIDTLIRERPQRNANRRPGLKYCLHTLAAQHSCPRRTLPRAVNATDGQEWPAHSSLFETCLWRCRCCKGLGLHFRTIELKHEDLQEPTQLELCPTCWKLTTNLFT